MKTEWTLKEMSNWTKTDSEVKIPAIQRGLVWKPHQVELLWDSILRQFPIGAFTLSHLHTEGTDIYNLIDGQQRWNAVALGYGTLSHEDCILWFDLKPDDKVWGNSKTTRKYIIRATTKAHPWGYKANDDCNTLNTAQKRVALQEFGVNTDNEYEGTISLTETYPIESGLPIPLCWMIAAGEEHSEDKDGFAKCIMDKIEENKTSRKFKLKQVDEINDGLIVKYYEAFKSLAHYKVPTINILQETIDNESEDKSEAGALSDIEILFNRIGTGGTPITQSELMYSAVKAYWSELTEENDRLATLYMPPQTLISLAFQLVLSTMNKGLERAPSVAKIRKLAGDDDLRKAINKLYCTDGKGSVMSHILVTVDHWLTNYDKIPKVLRTTIARKSPEVYLLLMIFAKWKEEGQIDPILKEEALFRATAYYLHWMVDDKFGVANSIYKAVANNPLNEWRTIIKRVLLVSCVKGTIIPLLSPEAFRSLFIIEGDKNWRPDGNGRSSMPWCPLWKTVSYNEEMLLYAQREYMCKRFPNYDPARQDLWEDKNRPWDFDHIIPQDWIHRQRSWRQAYTDYCKAWKDNNGNMAAIPFWVNRAKSNEANWEEYKENPTGLLADDDISDFDELFNAMLNSDAKQAKCFAEKTFTRMCKIYNEVYALLEPVDFRVGGITFTEKGGLKDRNERMTTIRDILVKEGFTAGIYYLYVDGDMEYSQENVDDWTREWMSCGCITENNYYAAFTMVLYQDGSIGDQIEIGLRRLPQTAERSGKVTEGQLQKLRRYETYELYEDNNPWWHICKEISIDTDNDIIINELKELAKFASKELQ